MTPKTRKDNRAWAKTYAELGWSVLPLHSPRNGKCSCGKPLDHRGAAKHPHTRNGVKDATTDLARIDAWFDKWPDANVGVACGAESGIDTIDIDVQKGADVNGLGKLPPGPVFKTGGGGVQRLYLHQNGQGPSVGKVAEHVDVRGEGSYFVAPPSIHASGEPYRWRKGPRTPLQPFPRFSASEPAEAVRSDVMASDNGSTASEGGRHAAGKRVCVAMRLEGADTKAIRVALRPLNETFDPPYAADELRDFVRLAADSAKWKVSHESQVAVEVEKQRVRDEARLILARERAGPPFTLPDVGRTLAVELDEEDAPLAWAVKGIHIEGFSTTIIAQKKTGKTRLATNLARSLADGEPFLGYFDVVPNGRRTLYMNYELMPRLFKKWVREVGIENTDAIVPLHLQGAAFPFWTPELRPAFIAWLQANDIGNWIIDPAFRAWRGYVIDSNNNDQVGAFLYGELDSIKRDAGISNLWLLHHIGKSWRQEGAEEGAAAHQFGAWEDATWVYTKNKDGKRALRAEGREVDQSALIVEEVKDSKRLTTYGERRAEATHDEHRAKVLAALDAPLNATALRSEVGIDKNEVDRTVRGLIEDGCIERRYADETPVDERAPKAGVPIMHHRTADGDAELAAGRRGS